MEEEEEEAINEKGKHIIYIILNLKITYSLKRNNGN